MIAGQGSEMLGLGEVSFNGGLPNQQWRPGDFIDALCNYSSIKKK